MSLRPKDLKLYGNVYLHPDLIEVLENAPGPMAALLRKSLSAGYSLAAVHGGTHAFGYCADFDVNLPGWNSNEAHAVKDYLASHGCAVAFRVGASQYSTGSHLHIALNPHANAQAILQANHSNPWRNTEAINSIYHK